MIDPERGDQPDVTRDIGGVQGAADDESATPVDASAPPTLDHQVADRPAPEAAEIEWAGGLTSKPPAPGA